MSDNESDFTTTVIGKAELAELRRKLASCTERLDAVALQLAVACKARDEAEKDYAALNEDYKAALDCLEDQRKRAESAEAQVRTLREALTHIVKSEPDVIENGNIGYAAAGPDGISDAVQWQDPLGLIGYMIAEARAALSATPASPKTPTPGKE